MKKKILFIALHYPPSEGIADIRATNIALQLSRNNFDITVLTLNKDFYRKKSKIPKDVENIETIRINFFTRLDAGNIKGNTKIPKIIRRLLLKILPLLGLDYFFFWQRNAIKEVIRKNEKYDFIIATGPPFSNFLLAKRLSKRLKTKYIIDYRDPWSLTAHGTNYSNNIFNKLLEQRILKNADLIIFNSPSMQEVMINNFQFNKSIVLTNGYNSDVFKQIPTQLFNKFIISYVGTFYIPKRIIDPLFMAFKMMKDRNIDVYKEISFIYCGQKGDYINFMAKEYGVEEILDNRYLVERNDSFSITKSSNISVIITTVYEDGDLSEKSIIPGKVYEALGMNTKILCISPNGSDISKIVNSQKSGVSFNGKQVNEIVQFILSEFNSYKGCNSNEKNYNIINEFEWSINIKKLINKLR